MIETSKIIVLRCIDYQESSRIITALSQSHGKLSLIAKGVKKPKNKLAGVIEVGNILDVNYYYKPSRNIQTLSEASISYQSLNFRKDFERASILYSSLELISQLVHENEENDQMFSFVFNFINWLGEVENTHPSIFAYVQLRLAQLIGVGLIDQTSINSETVYLNISSGTLDVTPDTELAYKLTAKQALFLKKGVYSKNSEIFTIGLANSELKQLIHHLDVYFKYHIDGYKDRRSDTIFEQMTQEQ
jgi:DNA repair protein RecO